MQLFLSFFLARLTPGTGWAQSDLEKKRNDEETEEGWVQCDHCERWVHQICGLFNKGRNDDDMPYICLMCLLDGAPPPAGPPATLSVRTSAYGKRDGHHSGDVVQTLVTHDT